MATTPEPFDKFTMMPRNEAEFIEAIGHQGAVCLANNKGFAIPANYIWAALKIDDPVKAIDLIWRAVSPSEFRIWFDGTKQAFLVEPYELAVPARDPLKKSSLILPH